MLKIRYYINGVEIDSPVNHAETSIELNFDKDSPDARVSLTKYRFIGSSALTIIEHIDKGKNNTGAGIFEGLPFKIQLDDGTDILDFDLYLDFSDELEILDCDDVVVTVKERKKIDWINDVADGFSLEYLFETKQKDSDGEVIIDENDTAFIAYRINYLPDYRELYNLSITAFTTAATGEKAFYDHIVTGLTFDIQFWNYIIRVVWANVYSNLVTRHILLIAKQMLEQIVQPIKYHAGMFIEDQLIAGAKFLDMEFKSSTIFNNQIERSLFIIPAKANPPEFTTKKMSKPLTPKIFKNIDGGYGSSTLYGFEVPDKTIQRGYLEGTYGDLLRTLKTLFNAKVIIDGNTLRLERIDYAPVTPLYQLPDLDQPEFKYNTDEFIASTAYSFQTDFNDRNTVDNYLGTSYQVTLSNKFVTNSDLVSTKGLKQIDVPFARGIKLDSFTRVEKKVKLIYNYLRRLLFRLNFTNIQTIFTLNKILEGINGVKKILKTIGILKKAPKRDAKQLEQPILPKLEPLLKDNRRDMLVLENDMIEVPKLLYCDKLAGGNIKWENRKIKLVLLNDDNNTTITAKRFFDKFYQINLFSRHNGNTINNQFIIKTLEKVPFCFEDYKLIRDNNKVQDAEGRTGFIDSIQWNVWDRVATLQVRISQKYCSFDESIAEPENN